MLNSKEEWRIAAMLIAGLVGSQLALLVDVGPLFLVAATAIGAYFIARRPVEAIWIAVFLLVVAAQVYPFQSDELGTALRGIYRPYIGVVSVAGAAMLVGTFKKKVVDAHPTSADPKMHIRGPIAALLGVFVFVAVYSYFKAPAVSTFWDLLRECSGWMTFLLFLVLAYGLSTPREGYQQTFERLSLVAFTYSSFFIIKYVYAWLSAGQETATDFGYSQRDAVFFSGVVFVCLVAKKLAPQTSPASFRRTALLAVVLLVAVLFCGSRAVLGSTLLVALSFLMVRYTRTWARIGLLGAALAVVFVSLSFIPASFAESQGDLLTSLANRFLSAPTEDSSFLARASQWMTVLEVVKRSPLLGAGMLTSYSFFDPYFGWKDTTFIDSGIGYLLLKTGLLGTVVFFWFAVAWLKMVGRLRRQLPLETLPLLASFAFFLAFLLFEPSFFEFQHSWFIGIVVGGTVHLSSSIFGRKRSSIRSAIPQSVT